jgi:allophanate hydrolase subunit 2
VPDRRPRLEPRRRFRAVAGPQLDHFSESEIASFFDSAYTVCAGSNRMGMQLAGRRIVHARGFNIISDAIAPGSIQVPGSGQPIVLLADRQTTGGYPKIAAVISADMPALGRTPIGATISFERVSIDAAQALRRSLLTEVDSIPGRVIPLREPSTDDIAPRLLHDNLISGVVDARSGGA